jgi:dTDP-4-dehydrorhamnose reductase
VSLALEGGEWEVTATYLHNPPPVDDVTLHRLDVADRDGVWTLMEKEAPDLIVHTAAIADIDVCQRLPELAWKVNADGTRNMAEAAAKRGAKLVHLSTSNVFDGREGHYSESDQTCAINTYAETKIAAEKSAACVAGAVIVRTSLVLGLPKPIGRSFLAKTVARLRQGMEVALPREEIRSPVDSRTLSSCILELSLLELEGIFHVAGTQALSRYDMGLVIADKIGCDPNLIVPMTEIPVDRAPRPRDATLDTAKARSLLGVDLPDCAKAVERALAWA